MKKNKSLIIILILLFFQGIIANIHHPLTPAYVDKLNLPNYMFGFFFAFMNLGMLVGAPIWGSLADSGKKKISVILGYSIYGFFQLLFGLGHFFGPWTLSIIRFLSGFGIAAAFTVVISEIIIISDNQGRAKNIAMGGASLAVGGAIGKFLGGQLYTNQFLINIFKTNDIFYVLLIQFILSLVLALYVLLLFKPKEIKQENKQKRTSFLDGFKEIGNIKKSLLIFLIALTLITIAQTNIDKYLDVYFINELNYDESVLGTFSMIVGLIGAIISVLIVPQFMKVKKRLVLLSIFQAISAILIFIIFYFSGANFLYYMYSVYLIYIFVKTTNEPLEKEYISTFADDSNMGKITGVRHSFYSLGTIIGPIVGAFIYDYRPKLVFYTSAVIFLVSITLILLSGFIKRKEDNEIEKVI